MARKEKERRGRRRGNTVSVNWSEAEINNRVTRPGTYAFKVTKAEEGDEGQIIMDAEVTSEGRQEGKVQRTYFNTSPQALWVLARFLEAIDEEVPDDEGDIDLDEWVDKEFMATVEENEYEGKVRLRIAATSFANIDELEDEPGDKSSSKKAKAKEEEPEEEEEEAPAKRGRGRPAGSKNKAKTTGGKEEEDDEEEEPKGKRGSKGKKEKDLPKLSADEIQDMSEEELEDLIQKYDLEADIDEAKTLRKKAALVLDELETKDLLEEDEPEPAKGKRR